MSGWRTAKGLAEQLGGRGARTLRALATLRQIVTDTYDSVTERVLVRGRTTSDQNAGEDGEFDEVTADTCQPVGLVARPAANATVSALVLNVGADSTNPVMIGTIDSTRKLVIDTRGMALDVTILYNTTDVVELRDGKIRAGAIGGSTEPLATKADVDALRAYVDHQLGVTGHVHAGIGTPPVAAPPPFTGKPIAPNNAPLATGTQRFEAE